MHTEQAIAPIQLIYSRKINDRVVHKNTPHYDAFYANAM